MWPLWLLPMLLGVKPWEARLRQSTAQWRKGGKRELLPGTLLAFSVAKDTQRKHKLVDTAWMQSYAGVARQHGHSNINAVVSHREEQGSCDSDCASECCTPLVATRMCSTTE